MRPLAYRGFGGEMGVNPAANPVDVSIAVWAWGAYLGDDAVTKGVRVTFSSWRRGDPNNIPPTAKATGAYINASMAKLEATQAGFDEAIMLNPNGRVAEATGQNLFVVRDGELLTPPLVDGPLPGITQRVGHEAGGGPGDPGARDVAQPRRTSTRRTRSSSPEAPPR